ncbi:M28 family metallopeptidase [Terriglobus saanensis]|uniref:Glutamate carboxypeptidase II n=1 Tax=Terriglobus saanensis (strain ATCC BAA-1853 / DSM 23119 / SP1PR4) TaxID=401053 RepID=E8V4U3_TERSS|nr:M28 family metallopeptidase [Terriglobus saanensis]ADV82571.1 Glutamate carboxypeptidase II [Terriglobus saanensis SP1PR4]
MSRLFRVPARVISALCVVSILYSTATAQSAPQKVFGYRDFTEQAKLDTAFMAVPDAKLAGTHLKELTKAPHWASSPEDYATAEYVAAKFKAAGLETEIVPYRVYLNKPKKIVLEARDADGKVVMTGPTKEHVDPSKDGGDLFQDDLRVLPAFNGSSPSGDITGEVVYANYGTLADFKTLRDMGVDLKGKIALVRYGQNFRGVKVYIAQKLGMAGVLIYSDPADDGYVRGDMYPKGPYRPESGVQRGSVQFIAKYTGDPMTPGVASTMSLPESKRLAPDKLTEDNPSIPSNPISYHDALPILQRLGGPASPRNWQGGLPFTYHLGSTATAGTSPAVKVHMHLEQDYAIRTIWDVIGKIRGTEDPDAWVVAGNHRDAWVYGAVDPNSGTAAMLETVHGLGELIKQGWKPKRTIVIGSWDAEEEGLVGSTEWTEEHAEELSHAVAYFNTDVGVSGPHFNAEAVPSLKQFVREVTQQVPSPSGGTVYDAWKHDQQTNEDNRARTRATAQGVAGGEVRIGNLGSGSDYTPFFQHVGVPATDFGSGGNYGVYHSVFDNYNWFIKFADPTFVYEQQQARVLGLEILHMADADVLPYDYRLYGQEVVSYINGVAKDATAAGIILDTTALLKAAERFRNAGEAVYARQNDLPTGSTGAFNASLRKAEEMLLNPVGLPERAWFKHTIYAPGEFTGYAAVVIPGITEALDGGLGKPNATLAQDQAQILTDALNRSALVLEAITR